MTTFLLLTMLAFTILALIDRWRNGPYLAPIEDDDMPDMPLAAMPGERRGAA